MTDQKCEMKPINFPPPFADAVIRRLLAGDTAQCRWPVKPQPAWIKSSGRWDLPIPKRVQRAGCSISATTASREWHEYLPPDCCPYGTPGERRWVQEMWAVIWTKHEPDWADDETVWDVPHRIEYRADSGTKYPGHWPSDAGDDPDCPKWHPSIFMPREASRLTVECVGVRVELVEDISEADAQASGLERPILSATEMFGMPVHPMTGYYRDGFRDVWDSAYASRGLGWAANPWVWAGEYKRVEDEG